MRKRCYMVERRGKWATTVDLSIENCPQKNEVNHSLLTVRGTKDLPRLARRARVVVGGNKTR